MIVASTGPIGLDQRFCAVVEKAWKDGIFIGLSVEVAKHLCRRALEDFQFTGIQPGGYGALVAFPVDHRPHLVEFAVRDFQPEFKTAKLWYCSMGSGQQITDPFLGLKREVFWEHGPPSTQDALFAITWTLQHVIDVNPGGVNSPINVAVLERGKKDRLGARLLANEELAQHQQNIVEAKAHLRSFRNKLQPGASPDVPDVPKP